MKGAAGGIGYIMLMKGAAGDVGYIMYIQYFNPLIMIIILRSK